MKQHGALFTTENRVAIREDRKTMTRRIPASFKEVNEHIEEWEFEKLTCMNSIAIFCSVKDGHHTFVKIPWAVGDELYIKEPHYLCGRWVGLGRRANGRTKWYFHARKDEGIYFPDNFSPEISVCKSKDAHGWFLRSPLFMPKWAAREWLRVTDLKVERLQEISEEDCVAEGITTVWPKNESCGEYVHLWNRINGKKHPWERNEWVVAYTFERILVSAEPVQGRC
jgi:hypothetical protein